MQGCKTRLQWHLVWSRFWAQAPKSSKKSSKKEKNLFATSRSSKNDFLFHLHPPPPLPSYHFPSSCSCPGLPSQPSPPCCTDAATLGQLPTNLMMRVNGEVRANGAQKCVSWGRCCGLAYPALHFWRWISHLYGNPTYKFGFMESILFGYNPALQKISNWLAQINFRYVKWRWEQTAGLQFLCTHQGPSSFCGSTELWNQSGESSYFSSLAAYPEANWALHKGINAPCVAPTQSWHEFRLSLSQARLAAGGFRNSVDPTVTSCAKLRRQEQNWH